MAKRPSNTKGTLVFQEGKRIEGDYYIIAVYDDPASCSVTFAAYELETDETYCLPYTYTELDDLFRFNSEMMNPTNKDGRYHWVIERLDFIVNDLGKKVLCLAPEPTPEEVTEDEDPVEKKKKGARPFLTGKVDAATRAKLIKELETLDDRKLQHTLVKSEEARKRFLQELHQKRRLEQLKATQRMLKMDEEREDRMAKLEHIKKTTREKALKFKTDAEVRTQTVAQLEVLMKQKEAEAIRRLVDDKEREEHHREQRLDMAMQKKKAQERNWREAREVEQEKIRLLEKKRKEAMDQRNAVVMRRNREIAKTAREFNEEARREQLARDERKAKLAEQLEEQNQRRREQEAEKRDRYQALDEVRDQKNLEREVKRQAEEAARVRSLQLGVQRERESAEKRKQNAVHSYLWKAQLEAKRRAEARQHLDNMNAIRYDSIAYKEEERQKKKREEEFLKKGGAAAQRKYAAEGADDPLEEGAAGQRDSSAPLTEEDEEFQKRYEAQDRERRRLEREAERDGSAAGQSVKGDKEKSVQSMYGNQKQRNEVEVARYVELKQADYDRRANIEQNRMERERRLELASQKAKEQALAREELFAKLERLRDMNEQRKDEERLQRVLAKVQKLPLGTAIPKFLPI